MTLRGGHRRLPVVGTPPDRDGARAWRSLEDRSLGGDEGARRALAGALGPAPTPEELRDPSGRREFLGLAAAAAALAGVGGGCARRPVEKIVPYARAPEDVVPGIPSHYATAIQRRGDAIGLVVECHEGRPTKIEGNPAHPSSVGATDLVTQAVVLDLYDPDRSRGPRRGGAPAGWQAFQQELGARLEEQEKKKGRGLRVLTEPLRSPTAIRLRERLLRRFPEARVHAWSAAGDSSAREGTRIAFGAAAEPVLSIDRARVVLALDADFLGTESGSVRATKGFAASRRLRSPSDAMSRLYVVEPSLTVTGAAADHRLRLPARDVERYLVALAADLSQRPGVDLGETGAACRKAAQAEGIPPRWIAAVAKDLAGARGTVAVVPGSRQPPAVHALAHALNVALGAAGATVAYAAPADPDERDHATDLRDLVQAMRDRRVEVLVVVGGNPVYDAPGDAGFAEALAAVGWSVHFAGRADETSRSCTWHAPRAHELESWSDVRALGGALAVQQPLIAPMYWGRSDIEVLAGLAGGTERSGRDLVQQTVAEMLPAAGSDRGWRRVLRDGVADVAPPPPIADAAARLRARDRDLGALVQQRAAAARRPLGPQNLEVTFAPDARMFDGRHANNAWLLELPDPVTKICWDNAALVSRATAAALGVRSGDVVRLSRGGRSVEVAAWILPGQADGSIGLSLGWGRKAAGRLGDGRGFDVSPLRSIDALGFADGVSVAATGARHAFSQTQDHHAMEGRPIVREATLDAYRADPHFAERMQPPPRARPLWNTVEYKGHKWGMSIDLNACTGCSACVVACQAENNVPVVGKDEVARGREMHWIRIDRYFVEDPARGATIDDPAVAVQPVACQQCEEAPCEQVCPVNATTHSPEGLNDMAYNRCVGTKYCANNCPYKVRRFNYLNWQQEVWGLPYGDPPETVQMANNPNVTVRFRGVMEKCTYCVQRVQAVKLAAKRQGRVGPDGVPEVRDGEIRTACQEVCPADAIVFGDLNDPQSRVAAASALDRRYGLLAEIGVRPRTAYLARVRNPNPEMAG